MDEAQQSSFGDNFPLVFEEGVGEFAYYQRQCPQGYKSKAQKRKEKVMKVQKHVKDPERRRLQKTQQRRAQNVKTQQIISHMTQEEAKEYLSAIKRDKVEKKQKIRKAMGHGQVFMVDIAYEGRMSDKENKSLAKQIELIMRVIKHFEEPPSIHVCSFEGVITNQMDKMGYQKWAVSTHQENVAELGLKFNKKLVYLSPDAELQIESIEKDTAYILGGLVDRSVLRDASLRRAEELGVQARRLPIAQFMKGRLCLNLDHVVDLMCKFNECRSWKEAFEFAAPNRWKKDASQPQKEEKPQKLMSKCSADKQAEQSSPAVSLKKEEQKPGQQPRSIAGKADEQV